MVDARDQKIAAQERVEQVLNVVGVTGVLACTAIGAYVAGQHLPAGVYPRAVLAVPGLVSGGAFWLLFKLVGTFILRRFD